MQRSCKCDFMYGDSTDAEMALKIDKALEMQTQESVEILVYQKNSELNPRLRDAQTPRLSNFPTP